MSERSDRFSACMLGLAVGDALGAPVEGMKAGRIRQECGTIEGFLDPLELWPDKPSHWRLKGLYTDDTQQALALAEVLLEKGRADAEALAALYKQLLEALQGERYYFGCHRGTGANFRASVLALAEGGDVFTCGRPSAGSGAAMRIAPLGLFHCDDPMALRDGVVEASLITHSDPRALAGAAALARGVSLLVQTPDGAAPAGDEICAELVAFTRAFEQHLKDEFWDYLDPQTRISGAFRMSEALAVLAPAVREGNDDLARRSIVAAANRGGPEFPLKDVNQGFAPATVTVALYYGLTYASYIRGVLAAINDGRDTDTVGAMTGALLGARLGLEAIPGEWRRELINAEQIALRGEMLATGEIDWVNRRNLVEMERELTQREIKSLTEALHRYEKRREKHAKRHPPKPVKPAAPSQEDAPFAPPPEQWLAGGGADPVTRRREKARRGKKRIDWKEERRRKGRRGGEENSERPDDDDGHPTEGLDD